MNMLNVSHVFLIDLKMFSAELKEAALRGGECGPRIISYNVYLYPKWFIQVWANGVFVKILLNRPLSFKTVITV